MVGAARLKPFPFLYMDKNDKNHPDMGGGYRQYHGCSACLAQERAISAAQQKRREESRLRQLQELLRER